MCNVEYFYGSKQPRRVRGRGKGVQVKALKILFEFSLGQVDTRGCGNPARQSATATDTFASALVEYLPALNSA